jgi:protein-disulfide isomerase
MTSKWTIPSAILVAGVLLAGAVYFSLPHSTSTSGNLALVRPVGSQDHIFGNPGAKVLIVEYADFDCEFCSGMSGTLRQIVANEGAQGEVAWVYREFPLTEIHPNAFHHAEAAECAAIAGGNDAFWKFADLLYANQPVDPSQYGTFAQTLSIPGDTFASCYANASSTVEARISADRKNALAIGADGTPFSLILVSGQAPLVIDGSAPYEAVKALVDQALASVHK